MKRGTSRTARGKRKTLLVRSAEAREEALVDRADHRRTLPVRGLRGLLVECQKSRVLTRPRSRPIVWRAD